MSNLLRRFGKRKVTVPLPTRLLFKGGGGG